MKVTATALPEVVLIEPRIFRDQRGDFFELWRAGRVPDPGVPAAFVQDNVSRSERSVLRGLHLQHPLAQGKLVTVLSGSVFDVAVDVRVGSPRFGQWAGVELSDRGNRQLYVPPGFAHGMLILSAEALISYKCTEPYAPEFEITIRWDDPDLAIAWPISSPVLSARDSDGVRLRDIPLVRLPPMP